MTKVRRQLLLGCALGIAVIHLAVSALHHDTLASWTKPLPILLLAAYAGVTSAPRLLVIGLLFSAAGDVALDTEGLFLIGMGLFGAAHAAYLALFIRHRRTIPWIILATYLAAGCVLVVSLWPGLGELRAPATGYSLLLTASAIAAAGVSVRIGIGGGLFWISDALIATGLAGWHWLPAPNLWVMTTYYTAQFLLGSSSYTTSHTSGDTRPGPTVH